MKGKNDRRWNKDVAEQIKKLGSVKRWLDRWIEHKGTDWESQRSAHQALKLLEMAEFEMWNMQWFKDPKERQLYRRAEELVNGK